MSFINMRITIGDETWKAVVNYCTEIYLICIHIFD